MEIRNSVALVTGSNRGIGEAFVRALVEAGASRVYAGSRDPSAASHLVELAPDRVEAIALDVTNPEDVAAAAARCTDVEIVINNAGIFANHLLIGASDMEGAREEMEVNYFGSLAMCRAFAPVLAGNGGGAIVNVLSVAAIVSVPNMGGYSPSKFAARAMTSAVRAELLDQGTQVTALIVGSVDTRMSSHVAGKKEPPGAIAAAGLRAITEGIDEMETDPMASAVRGALERDPKALESRMAAMLKAKTISTGR